MISLNRSPMSFKQHNVLNLKPVSTLDNPDARVDFAHNIESTMKFKYNKQPMKFFYDNDDNMHIFTGVDVALIDSVNRAAHHFENDELNSSLNKEMFKQMYGFTPRVNAQLN